MRQALEMNILDSKSYLLMFWKVRDTITLNPWVDCKTPRHLLPQFQKARVGLVYQPGLGDSKRLRDAPMLIVHDRTRIQTQV